MASRRELISLSGRWRPSSSLPSRLRRIPISNRTTFISLRFNSQIPPRPPPSFPQYNPKQSQPPSPASSPSTSDTTKPTGRSGSTFVKSRSDNLGTIARAWSTPTKWYPIPLALGALVLLAVQYWKSPEVESQREGGAVLKRADGPWQVRVLGYLPLRSLSQLWGYLNGLVLPVWFRPFGFKLYARIFGCNLDECAQPDLTQYESLGEFFYRELKPGLRPIANAPMVSPADGRVLHFGEIVGENVEQVKGITYSLQALLGQEGKAVGERTEIQRPETPQSTGKDHDQVVHETQFAEINDIPYSLSSLLGSSRKTPVPDPDLKRPTNTEKETDASHHPHLDLARDTSVAATLGSTAATKATEKGTELSLLNPENRLFFLVVYLAPGDYHRFHSPTTWVVERRRHFTGDLFSVSPYIANRLKDLFVLNERVALLGRWKHGFYSMVPVGATNVGSIVINFDKALRTNTRKMSHPAHTFTEAVYSGASVLQGQPLLAGDEMGGFKLGSTIVMVFEAPKNWKFDVKAGDLIKVGEAVGHLD